MDWAILVFIVPMGVGLLAMALAVIAIITMEVIEFMRGGK